MATTINLAWRNLWRNWRRTIIALIAVVLGLILLIFFDALIRGSDQAIFGNAVRLYGGNLQIHATGFRERANRMPLLPLADPEQIIQAVRAEPTVVAATRRIVTAGVVTHRGTSLPVAITAIEPESEASLSLQAASISAGRFLQNTDSDAILIGNALAERLELQVGDALTLIGRSKNEAMRPHRFTIRGIYNLNTPEIEKASVFIPLSDAQVLYNLRGQSTSVAIFLQQIGSEQQLASQFQQQLPAYEVDSWQTLRPEITQTMSSKLAFTSFLGIVVLLIAAIGILNLMLMAAFERTREMGVLAALGMKGRQLMLLFLTEGAMIGLVGAVVGCTVGGLLVGLVSQVGIDLSRVSGSGLGEAMALLGNRLYPAISLPDLISRGLLAIVIAAIASLYPAWQASQREPAQALRHL
jgi:ABC-type lipoprotein release transport system permease subunit